MANGSSESDIVICNRINGVYAYKYGKEAAVAQTRKNIQRGRLFSSWNKKIYPLRMPEVDWPSSSFIVDTK